MAKYARTTRSQRKWLETLDFPEVPPYSFFARCYDGMMVGLDYRHWAEYIKSLFIYFGLEGKRVLDLACGTGRFLANFADMGYTCIGVDISEEMLARARERFGQKSDLLFRPGDMRMFQSEQKQDAVLCLHDSVNYLVEEEDVSLMLDSVSASLKEEGLFIFDVSTRYNIRRNFAGQTFVEECGAYAYIWRNYYAPLKGIATVELDFLLKGEEEGSNRMGREYHVQRIYSLRKLRKIIRQQGDFTILGCFDEFTFKKAGRHSESATFVLQKTLHE